jgi:undecaprenyl-diphosphatase
VNFKRRSVLLILFVILNVFVSDQVSSHIIKPIIKRARPCNDTTVTVRQLVNCSSGYSFPSSHASNHFAFAIFLLISMKTRRSLIWLLLIGWAFSISYSQIYVGVHYPSDIAGGIILGCLSGWFVGKLYILADRKLLWMQNSQ